VRLFKCSGVDFEGIKLLSAELKTINLALCTLNVNASNYLALLSNPRLSFEVVFINTKFIGEECMVCFFINDIF
jgi:hypothetical protein